MGNEFSQIARCCERAVVTAYRDLRHLGSDDPVAFRACTVLYRIHDITPINAKPHESRVRWTAATNVSGANGGGHLSGG